MNKKIVYKITSPKGEMFTTDKMFKFCKDRDLNASCMFNVARNRHGRTHHKGWKVEIITVEEVNKLNIKNRDRNAGFRELCSRIYRKIRQSFGY